MLMLLPFKKIERFLIFFSVWSNMKYEFYCSYGMFILLCASTKSLFLCSSQWKKKSQIFLTNLYTKEGKEWVALSRFLSLQLKVSFFSMNTKKGRRREEFPVKNVCHQRKSFKMLLPQFSFNCKDSDLSCLFIRPTHSQLFFFCYLQQTGESIGAWKLLHLSSFLYSFIFMLEQFWWNNGNCHFVDKRFINKK